VVTGQPGRERNPACGAARYSQKALIRYKRARVSRDLTLCIGGIVFAVASFVIPVPSHTVTDPIWIFALVVAVYSASQRTCAD
jgi:hypothetical protein